MGNFTSYTRKLNEKPRKVNGENDIDKTNVRKLNMKSYDEEKIAGRWKNRMELIFF